MNENIFVSGGDLVINYSLKIGGVIAPIGTVPFSLRYYNPNDESNFVEASFDGTSYKNITPESDHYVIGIKDVNFEVGRMFCWERIQVPSSYFADGKRTDSSRYDVGEIVKETTNLDNVNTQVNFLQGVWFNFPNRYVDVLPAVGTNGVFYFVPNGNATNIYIYSDAEFHLVGSTSISLADFYTKAEINSLLDVALNERLKGVKVDGVELTPDANKMVDIPVMAGASTLTNGEVGLVPKPLIGQQGTFLRGDGTYGLPNADVVASASYIGGVTPQLNGMTDCFVVEDNVEILLEYSYVAREAFSDAVDIVCVMRNGLGLAEGKDFSIEEGIGLTRKKITLIDYPLNTTDIILVRYKTSIGVYGSVFQETIDNAIQVTNEANTAAQRAEDAAIDAETIANSKIDKTAIKKVLGTSETDVMSQKAITDELGTKANHGYESNPKTLKEVDDDLVQLAGETSILMKDVPFLRNGFPMALKGNILENITVSLGTVGIGNVLSPSLFSDFLLDFKLQGVPESGYSYEISRVNNAVGDNYSYYIQISKFNEGGEMTTVANCYFSSNSLGVNKYEVTPVSAETNVTKIILLLDWDAIKHIPGTYTEFYTAGYRFKNEYLFDLTTGKIAEDLAELNKQIYIENLVSIANAKVGTEDKTVFQLENDLNILDGNYGFRNIGQYTKKLSTTSAFNVVRLNKVAKSNTIPVDYKICVVKVTGSTRECPTGVISPNTHRIIKEGQLTFTYSYSDYIIKLDDVEVCPAGSQVVIFLSATDREPIGMRGRPNGVGNSEKTSNVALLSTTDTPFDGGSWDGGSVNEETNIGWFNVALTLLYEPIFVTREDLSQQINDVETIANQADAKAILANEKIITEETTTWELANDLTFFDGQYAYQNIGQYTKVFTEAVAFSQVRLNLVSHAGDVQYKVCIVNGIASSRDCPVGSISPSTHTVLKEGTLTLTTGYKDYFIDLGNVFICPAGSQVAIYMVSVSGNPISMRGISAGLDNPEKTSNVSLLSTANNPFDGGIWGAGGIDESTNMGYFNVALSLRVVPLFVTKEELGDQVEQQVEILVPEYMNSDIKLTIPNKVYAVVGTELNLWNDAVSLSVDKGLASPINYQVRWYCTKGLITERGFRFTPTDSDVGTVSCTCYIYDMRGSLIDSKTFSIIVSAKNAIAAAKNIIYFGDSLGSSAASGLYNNFNNVDKFTGIIPTMQGTNGTTYKYEAIGGYRWEDYATAGRIAYRCFVSGVGSIPLGSKYTNNDYTWTVIEVNISEGIGNILITTYAPYGYPDAPTTNGTLISVSPGVDIPYTNATLMGANPLWNNDTNALDISLYKTRIGLQSTDKIDAVSFQFGINDNGLANDLTTLMQYINSLYQLFISDNVNCKFIIGLTTSAGNTLDGSGANYGASNEWKTYLENVYKIRIFYLTLQNNASYPNIIIAPVSLGIDRYYGYNLAERAISQRVATTEKYHTNYVHAGTSGYGQIADMYFATYIYALTI